MGALDRDSPPPVESWASGIFEFSTAAGDGVGHVPRRLVIRHAMSNPDKGVIFELYRPEVIDVRHPYLKVRGVEPVSLGNGALAAMVQEWLVVIAG